MESKYRFLNSGNYYTRVHRIGKRLISAIDSPVGFNYQLYLVESDEVNAFTAGGKIFVFTGILDAIESDDELASVLGHEIYHNELGHINKKLRRQVVLNQLMKSKRGKYAGLAMVVFGGSFNQDEETLCDLHGVDLAIEAGYNACSAINFWKRISKTEKSNNLSKWLRSHPFGKQRINCIQHHLSVNYGNNCTND
jgi:predicted Zn-dependent protease